jgi:hypothetical protein
MSMDVTVIVPDDFPEPPDEGAYTDDDGIFHPLNKKVHILIVDEPEQFIVFLDEELFLHWWYYDSTYRSQVEGYGEVVSRVANLEATSIRLLEDSQLEAFRRLLGESVARLLQDKKPHNAQLVLDQAELFMRARSREHAKIWYLSASLLTTLPVLLSSLFLWKNRQGIAAYFGVGEGAVHVLLGAAMGSLGALISVLLRSDKLKIDVSAGRTVHYFEGALRILLGMMAGLLFVFAVKADVLLSIINTSGRAIVILLVIAIIAGASERLLPNLIKQLEGTLVAEIEETKFPSGSSQKQVTKIESQSVRIERKEKKRTPSEEE